MENGTSGTARWSAWAVHEFFPARHIASQRPAYLRWRYNPYPAWLWLLYYPYCWGILGMDGMTSLMHRRSGQPG
jgi:hypothetical protein